MSTFWERLSINSCKLLVGSWVFIIPYDGEILSLLPGERVHLGTNLWAMCVSFFYLYFITFDFVPRFQTLFFFVSPFCHPSSIAAMRNWKAHVAPRCLRDKISSHSPFPIPLTEHVRQLSPNLRDPTGGVARPVS